MAIERTLSIIKPDAVERNYVGRIIAQFEESGLRPVAIRRHHLSAAEAGQFYSVHAERPFFGELVEYMTSGPVVISILEGDDAIKRHRDIMGATNPAEAAPGTIRADFAESIGVNTVHGSDAVETAAEETAYFFRGTEAYGRG